MLNLNIRVSVCINVFKEVGIYWKGKNSKGPQETISGGRKPILWSSEDWANALGCQTRGPVDKTKR